MLIVINIIVTKELNNFIYQCRTIKLSLDTEGVAIKLNICETRVSKLFTKFLEIAEL
ncbi:hypothetical protein [Clostridium tunisiense]|uniref:hypothetical protein n=1 Tax=Clostridium tunisiense TaxID=219748 RepID=UPI00031BD46F|nr:hypothetical protein [Clostridium tunisiense]